MIVIVIVIVIVTVIIIVIVIVNSSVARVHRQALSMIMVVTNCLFIVYTKNYGMPKP